MGRVSSEKVTEQVTNMLPYILLTFYLALTTGVPQICDRSTARSYVEDTVQCDKYYYCNADAQIEEELLCPDGLVFDQYSNKKTPCDHYFNVNCGNRTDLQTPKGPDDFCPRLYGYYSHPDSHVCNIYYSCDRGQKTEYICSPGLWFNEYKGVCDWPKDAEREDCYAHGAEDEEVKFQCPGNNVDLNDSFEIQPDPHPRFHDEHDCAKFFICLNRVALREHTCELGLVYNTNTKICDSPENVPECKCYYSDLLDDGSVDKDCVDQESNKKRK